MLFSGCVQLVHSLLDKLSCTQCKISLHTIYDFYDHKIRLRISNVIASGLIIHFSKAICKLTAFILYDSLMVGTRVAETCW
jgi:hypothetical protein